MKKVLGIIAALIVIIVVIAVVVVLNLGSIVKTGINTIVPQVTKCEASVEDVNVNVFSGRFEIVNLVIKNPQGFNTAQAFSLDRVYVNVNMKSLMSDVIEVREVLVDAPQITYEVGLAESNMGTILENVKSSLPEKAEEDKEKKEEKPDEGGKKVTIDLVKVTNGKIGLSAKLLQGKEMSVPLPEIEMKDIGKSQGGISAVQALAETMQQLVMSIIDVAKQALQSVGEAVKAVGDNVKSAAENVTENVKSVGESVKEVGESVKSAGESVKSAAEGLKNLIKK